MEPTFYILVDFAAPSREPVPIAVMLYLRDPDLEGEFKLFMRFREDWSTLGDEDDIEVLEALGDDLSAKSVLGPRLLLEHLEDTLSNSLRLSDRIQAKDTGDPTTQLNDLFDQHVGG